MLRLLRLRLVINSGLIIRKAGQPLLRAVPKGLSVRLSRAQSVSDMQISQPRAREKCTRGDGISRALRIKIGQRAASRALTLSAHQKRGGHPKIKIILAHLPRSASLAAAGRWASHVYIFHQRSRSSEREMVNGDKRWRLALGTAHRAGRRFCLVFGNSGTIIIITLQPYEYIYFFRRGSGGGNCYFYE
jgi:hypothetical protein